MMQGTEGVERPSNRLWGKPRKTPKVSKSKHQPSTIKLPVRILPVIPPPTPCEPPLDINQSDTRTSDFQPQTRPTDSKFVSQKQTGPPCAKIQSEDISAVLKTSDTPTGIKPSRRKRSFDGIEEEANDADRMKLEASMKGRADLHTKDGSESTVSSHAQSEEQEIARFLGEPQRGKKVTGDLDTESGRESTVTSHAEAED
ncbi:hypothetical protein PTTG_30164, partial [Puccinia triticina 1-1 BBBD Race 1]